VFASNLSFNRFFPKFFFLFFAGYIFLSTENFGVLQVQIEVFPSYDTEKNLCNTDNFLATLRNQKYKDLAAGVGH